MRATHALFLFVLGVAVILSSAAPAAGAEGPYPVLWKGTHRMDSLLSIDAADLNGDGRSEVLLAGRSYIDREFNVEIMDWANGSLKGLWGSPNIYEDYSSLILAAASFEGLHGVLALTRTRAYLYSFNPSTLAYAEVWQFKHDLGPGEMATWDFDGDGSDELVISKVIHKGTHYPAEALVMEDLTASGMRELGRTDDLGNIRSLAGGDFDGDGVAELLCEVGVEGKPGEILVYQWREGQFVPRARQSLTSVPVYGMTHTLFPDGRRVLLAATERGRLEAYSWDNGAFKMSWPETRFTTPLTDVAAGDLDGDSQVEIAVIGYPNMAAVLKR